jgi:hypothetical protein
MIGLEFGTYPMSVTVEALLQENWLIARGDPDSEQAASIKQALKDAFYINEADWQRAVSSRTMELVRKVKASLS